MAFWIQTVSGRTLRLDRPDPRDVHIDDIAHSLALQNRYNGHTRVPYSVAQHSVLVSHIVQQRQHRYPDPEPPVNLPLLGLLHDAHEAYCGDVVAPGKALLGDTWEGFENNIESAVAAAFALPRRPTTVELVREADMIARATEVRDLMHADSFPARHTLPDPVHERIVPMEWAAARDLFMARFWELSRIGVRVRCP